MTWQNRSRSACRRSPGISKCSKVLASFRAAERHSGDRAGSSQNASRQSTIGYRLTDASGNRASIGWQPTSKRSANESVMTARSKSVADNELGQADAEKE